VGPGRRAASSVPVVRRTGRRASSRALSTTRLTDRREPAGERSKRGVLEGVRAGPADGTGTRLGWRAAGQARQGTERTTAAKVYGITSEARKRERRDFASSLAPSDKGAAGARQGSLWSYAPVWEDRTRDAEPSSRAPAPRPGRPALGAVLPFNRTTCENSRDRTPHASPTRYYDTHDSMLRRTIQYTR